MSQSHSIALPSGYSIDTKRITQTPYLHTPLSSTFTDLTRESTAMDGILCSTVAQAFLLLPWQTDGLNQYDATD